MLEAITWIRIVEFLYGLSSLLILGAALYVIFCPQASLLGGMLFVVCAAFILFFIEYHITCTMIKKYLDENPEGE